MNMTVICDLYANEGDEYEIWCVGMRFEGYDVYNYVWFTNMSRSRKKKKK